MKITQQLIFRGLLTSPIIAILVCSPIYLVVENPQRTFLELWLVFTLGTMFCWGLQILLFSFLKKRNFKNWQYLMILLTVIIVILYFTNPSATMRQDFFKSSSIKTFLLFRSVLTLSINFIIYLIIDLVYTNENKVQVIKENAALKYSNLESNYKLLKDQINPHFLFNALNISKSLIKTNPQRAEKYVIKLSEFLRGSINNQQKSITLKKELENCQQYIDLQKVRFEDAFTFTVDVDERTLRRELPFYALITLAENAFKHNSFSVDEPLNILIKTKDDYVMVKNSLKIKKGVISTHTGLSNLSQRSLMLSNEDIDIENDGQHFSVKLKLIDS